MSELKPYPHCPFCGSNEVHVSISNHCTGVLCEECLVFAYPLKNDGYGDTEECERRAIDAWNRRAKDD